MARLHSNTPEGGLTSREKMWAAMRDMREFNIQELCIRTKMPRSRARDYIVGLVRSGILGATPGKHRGDFDVYHLEKDMGVNAPRVRRDGSFVPESGRTRMWKAMRILGTFSVRNLAGIASLEGAPVEYEEAEYYCRWLHQGGYLQRMSTTVYRFVPARDSGPKAPQILRVKQLYDPNRDEVIVTGERSGRDDE